MTTKLTRLRAMPGQSMLTPEPLNLLEDLSPAALARKYNLSRRMADFNRSAHRAADALIAKRSATKKPLAVKASANRGAGSRGPAPMEMVNELHGYICRTDMGSYWTDDTMQGVAGADNVGSTRPLSVSIMFDLLEDLDVFSIRKIMDATGLDTASAKRYFQALRIAMPHLMKSRTVELARALGDVTTVIEVEKYMSSAADLARLRADMGDDAFTSTNHLPPAAAPRV